MELVAIRRNSVQDCDSGAVEAGVLHKKLQLGFARRLDERFEAGVPPRPFLVSSRGQCAVNPRDNSLFFSEPVTSLLSAEKTPYCTRISHAALIHRLLRLEPHEIGQNSELLAERPERGGLFLGRAGRTRLRQVRQGRSCS